jgi:hypothetical protein
LNDFNSVELAPEWTNNAAPFPNAIPVTPKAHGEKSNSIFLRMRKKNAQSAKLVL